MPVAQFDNLGEYGIIEDIDPNALPHNAWTAGRNVRFFNNAVVKFSGEQAVFGTPLDTPYYAFPVIKGDSSFWMYASLTDIYSTDGSNHYTISASTGSAQATADINWNGGVLAGGVVVLNNGVDAPYAWTGSTLSDAFTNLANWPAGMVAKLIRPFKQTLVAANIDEGSGFDPTLIRWSHPAAPGSVPASWDDTDPAYDAGRTSALGIGGDPIVEMQMLRDLNIIYKEDSTWSMQFVGGDSIYAFRRIFDTVGALSSRCVKPLLGRHVVLGNGEIYMHDGSQVEQFLSRTWRKWLFSSMDGTTGVRSFVVPNTAHNEIWICFPEIGQNFPNLALIWNWKDNTTQVRELPDGTAHMARGVVDLADAGTFDSQSGTFETIQGSFDQVPTSSSVRYMLGCEVNTPKFFRPDTTEQFDGADMTAWVRRDGLPLGRVSDDQTMRKLDLSTIKTVYEVWPVIEGTDGGVVNVYVGSRNTLKDATNWSGPHQYTIGATKKINVRKAGRIIDIRFESTTNLEWRLSSYAVKYEIGGVR